MSAGDFCYFVPEGMTLVEASAGTGKTEAISRIATALIAGGVVREPRRLVVVTFTKMAAGELRYRIRRSMRELLQAVGAHATSIQNELLKELKNAGTTIDQIRHRLDFAIEAFDEAFVSTIHAFCARLLSENALEVGLPLEPAFGAGEETVSGEEELLRAAVENQWRTFFHQCDAKHALLALAFDLEPAALVELCRKSADGHLETDPAPTGETCDSLAAKASELRDSAWQSFIADRAAVLRDFDQFVYKSEQEAACQSMALLQAAAKGRPIRWVDEFKALLALGESVLSASRIKRGAQPLSHQFFALCDTLREAALGWRACFLREIVMRVLSESEALVRATGKMTFDQMIQQTDRAFAGRDGLQRAQRVGADFDAALIDEFQDTDPAQYRILRALFSLPHHRVVFVGDPKQAIYGFRGASLSAYLRAKNEIIGEGRPLVLERNWRSSQKLVAATNSLFSRGRYFEDDQIAFQQVVSSAGEDSAEMRVNDQPIGAPMRLLALPSRDGNTEAWSVRDARRHLARATAVRVATLLRAPTTYRGTPLKAAEIAILVRAKSEIPEVQQALAEFGVASVVMAESSVLESVQADHVADCMRAWLEPSNPRRLHTALASPLFGFGAQQLLLLREDETLLNDSFERMATAAELWRTKGFGAAFRCILIEYETMPRLAGEVGGERALTNYLHIAEILNRVERERKLTPTALLRWLENPTLNGFAESDAASLRLESEERSVRILTMHKAKGLEFDVCFVLSGWSDPEKKKNHRQLFSERTDSDEEGNVRRVVDARLQAEGAAEENRASEEKRLLYVSLTRARALCYLAVPAVKTLEKSPTGTLLGINSVAQMQTALDDLAEKSNGTIAVELCQEPPPEAKEPLVPIGRAATPGHSDPPVVPLRKFSGQITTARYLTSFSAFAHQTIEANPDGETARDFEDDAPEIETAQPEGIHAFPKGRQTGHFFHSVFERLGSVEATNLEEIVAESLRAAGLDEGMRDVACAAVQNVLSAQISLPGQPERTFSLSQIPPEDRLAEVQFHIPCKETNLEALALFFEKHFTRRGGELTAQRLRRQDPPNIDGYLNGFIDLIFCHQSRYYVLDWKTNWLGADDTAYTKASVAGVMGESLYLLQMMIYLTALERLLRLKLKTDDEVAEAFGGGLYVFVRGVSGDQEQNDSRAIFSARPSREVLREFTRVLGVHG